MLKMPQQIPAQSTTLYILQQLPLHWHCLGWNITICMLHGLDLMYQRAVVVALHPGSLTANMSSSELG
jgi:hypothetical protein